MQTLNAKFTETWYIDGKINVSGATLNSNDYEQFKYKQEVHMEEIEFTTNIKTDHNFEELSENCTIDEKIDISEITLNLSESDNDTEKQRENTSLDSVIASDMHTFEIGSYEKEIINHIEHKTRINCPFCDKLFSYKRNLDDHLLKQHNQKIDLNSFITSKIYTCKSCSYKTTRTMDLNDHMHSIHNKHRTKINCQFCDRLFTKKYALDDHLLKIHKQEIKSATADFVTSKIHNCKLCSYQTTKTCDLTTHINSNHNEHRIKISCQFCDKSFTRKQSMNNHMLKTHKQEIKRDIKDFITSKIHKCKICNYETIFKSNFRTHINSNHFEDETITNCQFCDRSFTKKIT